ncbi:transposase [Paenibacillus lautus]|nr:transposase [Paenibacillus lautus]
MKYWPTFLRYQRHFETSTKSIHYSRDSSKRNRRVKRLLDRETYKEQHLVECFFNKVKNYRRLATRYEKTADMFRILLTLLFIRLWLK